jgi:hypothetical protein
VVEGLFEEVIVDKSTWKSVIDARQSELMSYDEDENARYPLPHGVGFMVSTCIKSDRILALVTQRGGKKEHKRSLDLHYSEAQLPRSNYLTCVLRILIPCIS